MKMKMKMKMKMRQEKVQGLCRAAGEGMWVVRGTGLSLRWSTEKGGTKGTGCRKTGGLAPTPKKRSTTKCDAWCE